MGEKEKGERRDKGREVRGGEGRGEVRGWNGMEERASQNLVAQLCCVSYIGLGCLIGV